MGSGKRWSDEEILFLQELWGSKTIPQIAKIMNRSENAIKVKSASNTIICINHLIIFRLYVNLSPYQ